MFDPNLCNFLYLFLIHSTISTYQCHVIRLFNTVESKLIFHRKVCQLLYSNRRPLVLEATALPTEPQPLPVIFILFAWSVNLYTSLSRLLGIITTIFFSGAALELRISYFVPPPTSVTSKTSPNVNKSSRKMILLEKWMILTTLQKLPKIVGDLGKLIVA